jgi:ABC-2 type transport system permease protein
MLPSSLTQPEMDNLRDYMLSGNPTLMMVDPLPVIDPALSPLVPAGAQVNPFQQNRMDQSEPKGNLQAFMNSIGVNFNPGHILWDSYQPHPDLAQLQKEIIFIGDGSGASEAFNQLNVVSADLQELVVLYTGYLFKALNGPFEFQPLTRTGYVSGVVPWNNIVQRGFFGLNLNRSPRHVATGESYVTAARVFGAVEDGNFAKRLDAVVIADIDLVSDQFFLFRERGIANLNFDNVSFFLNCMDVLVGDESFINLRKKRVRHRTLVTVEEQTKGFIEKRLEQEREAEEHAQKALNEAQERLNTKVAEVQTRADLDDQTKRIMVKNLQEVENRRFEVARTGIENNKEATVQRSKEDSESAVRQIQGRIKTMAVMLPPIPVFVMGVFIFIRRRRRELEGATAARRLRS